MIKGFCAVIALGLVGFIVFDVFSSYNDPTSSLTTRWLASKPQQENNNSTRSDRKRNVLLYGATPFFGEPLNVDFLLKRECRKEIQEYCSYTTDLSRSKEADAWLYHNIDFSSTSIMENWTTDQIHVMHSLESPLYQKFKSEPNKINWTMPYRRDSDVPWPYGWMEKKASNISTHFDLIWDMKDENLTTFWLISNCKAVNLRLEVARKAKEEGLELDIFGDCGDKQVPSCGRHLGDLFNCAAKIIKKYYFYLAFENSNCVDYMTEKFFNSLHLSYAVPIVIKREIYTKMGIPGSSFIALDDFKSIKEMVKFLQELKKNKEKYLSYHEWRNSWEWRLCGFMWSLLTIEEGSSLWREELLQPHAMVFRRQVRQLIGGEIPLNRRVSLKALVLQYLM